MTTSNETVRTMCALAAVAQALKAVDGLWSNELKKYVDRLPPEGQKLASKSIKDSVWGMIHLEGYEVLVVDSPLFQRMRRVKQLGTTYLTFPTADYSRFEHALGVMHQATRMATAIAERSENAEQIKKAQRSIRLACLLHDIGHLPMSHVLERHYSDFPDEPIDAAHEELNAELGIECQLSEFLSFLLIQSKSFRSFLVQRCGYNNEDIDGATLAILGFPPPDRPFIKQMISNVIDADKLDYMFRDSRYTSVPLPVDLDRLLFKLKLLPEKSMLDNDDKAGYLAIDLGGSHLIEDLIIARRILARQIYRHHKTLAAEQLILGVLEQTKPQLIDLIARDDTFLIGQGDDKTGILGLCSDTQRPHVQGEMEDFRYRRLPKRALARSFALLPRVPDNGGKLQVPEEQKFGELTLSDSLQLHDVRAKLAATALDTFNRLAKTLGSFEGMVSKIYFDGSTGPKPPEAELFVQRPDNTLQLYEGFSAHAAAFAHSPEDFNYVFYSGNPAAVALVHIAVEKTLFDEHKLVYSRGSADHAKVNFEEVQKLKHDIEKLDPGHFDQCRPLRPLSTVARKPKNAARMDALVTRFKKFRDPITKSGLLAFVDQFPDALVPAVLDLLEGIQFIEDSDAADKTRRLLDQTKISDAVLVPLTGLGESSSVMAYHLRLAGATVSTLEQAKASKAKQIIFFEDSLLSGKQAISVLLSQFGLEAPSKGDKVAPLKKSTQTWLKTIQIGFLFNVVADDGIKTLSGCCGQLDLQLATHRGKPLILGSIGTSANFSSIKKPLHLKQFLTDVGQSLLLTSKHVDNPAKWSEGLCTDRAFGYSGNGSLTIFQNNSPTSAITALWCKGGSYKGSPWRPLFPRQDPQS